MNQNKISTNCPVQTTTYIVKQFRSWRRTLHFTQSTVILVDHFLIISIFCFIAS